MRPQRQQPTRLPRPWDSPGKNTGVACHFLLQCMKVKSEREVAQSFPTLNVDCSLPGSSIHGIFQARVLEWGATYNSTISLQSMCLREMKTYTNTKTCAQMSIVSTNWWNKMWCSYTMEYYLAIKRNRVQIHAKALTNLVNKMLKETNDKRPYTEWFHYIYMKSPAKENLERQKSKLVVAQG